MAADRAFEFAPGSEEPIERIHSKQGFHAYEPGNRFAWLDTRGPGRVIFTALFAFNTFRIRGYLAAGSMVGDFRFHLNDVELAGCAEVDPDGWFTVVVTGFEVRAGLNDLRIVSLRVSAADDGRALSAAIATVTPLIRVPLRAVDG